jgi:glutathione S-transferase
MVPIGYCKLLAWSRLNHHRDMERWAAPTGIGLDRWPRLSAFAERVGDRPAAKAAMAAEGPN